MYSAFAKPIKLKRKNRCARSRGARSADGDEARDRTGVARRRTATGTLTPGALPPDSADRCVNAAARRRLRLRAFRPSRAAGRGRARLLQLAAAARVRAEGLSRDTDTYEPNSFKGTLHYPKPTPSENPRRKLKQRAQKLMKPPYGISSASR